MKPNAPALPFATAVLTALLHIAATPSARAQTQPPLSITKLNAQTVVVSWFGAAGVSYQLEKSTNLQTWTLAAPVIGGANASINFNFSVAGLPVTYFRLKPPPPSANTAVFTPSTGLLVIAGTDSNNTIVVSRNAAGAILINTGAMPVTGGTPTVANTRTIEIFGKGGDDQLTLDESGGAMPPARMYGELGNDILTGGSGADALHGGPGSDTLLGKGGTDILFGGGDNDTLTGGDADDQVFGEAGNDRMIWNPGDDTDLNEGGGDTDTVEVNGGGGAEEFTAAANGPRVRFDRVNPAPFAIDIGTSEALVLNTNGGNDSFAATGNLAALIQLTIDGGPGDDTILGGNGADVILGGDGADTLDGNQGNDIIFAGAGPDTIIWDPGDSSDTIEGQADTDTLRFNGSNANEKTAATASGSRVSFTRDVANITLDLNDVETIAFNAFGGTDELTVNNLTGTDVTTVIADLAASAGGGDLAVDNVIIKGTTADDVIISSVTGSDFSLSGLAARVNVRGFDVTDKVTIQTLEGDDIVEASATPAGMPALFIDGGAGNDILLGGAGGDTISGGDNDDVLLGGPVGVDVLDGGTGENVLLADGTNVSGNIANVFGDANGNSIVISRDAAGSIFSNGVAIPGATIANTSFIRVFGLAGNDTITFDESGGALPRALLFGGAGTDTITGGTGPDIIFGGINNDTLLGKGSTDFIFGGAGNDTITPGDADDIAWGEADNDRIIWNPGDDTDLAEGGGATDTVEVNGGAGAEQFSVSANGPRVRFDRLDPAPFSVDIGSVENLVLNANSGNDIFTATGNLAALIDLVIDGGPGDDTLSGGNGADIIIGGDGADTIDGNQANDTIFAGAGADIIIWDPGDSSDTIEGQADADRLLFNGSSAGELMAASANGGRVLFTRDIGNIVLDLDDVETIDVNLLGGADRLTVNSLAGTDVTMIVADLAAPGGTSGDGAADIVTMNGTAAVENFSLGTLGTAVTAFGIVPTVRTFQSEVANDRIILNGLGGTDTISVGAGVTGLIDVTFNQ